MAKADLADTEGNWHVSYVTYTGCYSDGPGTSDLRRGHMLIRGSFCKIHPLEWIRRLQNIYKRDGDYCELLSWQEITEEEMEMSNKLERW